MLLAAFSCTDDMSEELDGSWEYESPLTLGVSGSHLLLLDREIQKGSLGHVNNLLILKDDKVIFENYYNDFAPDSLNTLGRATQSIFTLFLGAIIENHDIPLDTFIINYFPEYPQYFDNIPQKDKITIRHLIDHESGFLWDDWDTVQDPADGDGMQMKSSNDWVDYVLSSRMIREPGMEFNYNSGHSILLSDILSKELNTDLGDYFETHFFAPLGIKRWQWSESPKGRLDASYGLKMATSEMAKVGQLVLKNGVTEKGDTIVSEYWIGGLKRLLAQSNRYWVGPSWYRFAPQNDILPRQFSNDVLFTWGDGGKYLLIVPHQNMVIVLNAECETLAQEQQIFKYIGDYIFASTVVGSQQ